MSVKRTVEAHLELGVVCYLLGGMSRRWVRDRIKSGELEGFTFGNKVVVSASSINKYLDNQRVKEPAPK